MTPQDIEEAARNKYNATGDSFWSSDEIYGLIYEGCLQMAREALDIENIYSTTSVIGQQSYTKPTNCISIKRVEFDGSKVERISFREDDSITNLDSGDTGRGKPTYYFEWDDLIYFRPIPDTASTVRIFTYDEPSEITSTSTIPIPTQFHRDLVNYVVAEMVLKDQNTAISDRYFARWNEALRKAKAWNKKRKRGDEFSVVKNDDDLPRSVLGVV